MGRSGNLKCHECQEFFNAAYVTKISGKNYCPKCAKYKKKEAEDYKKLCDAIYNAAGQDKDAMHYLMRQVKNLKDETGWKDKSILYTFEYALKEEPDLNIVTDGFKWVIEKYYVEAKEFAVTVNELSKFPQDLILDALNSKENHIVLKRSDIIKKDIEYKDKMKNIEYGPEIDLNSIEDEDEENYVNCEDMEDFYGII